MYKIEKKDYGYKIILSGFIYEDEMKSWVEESKKILKTAPKTFGVFVDMRTLKPLKSASMKLVQEAQLLYVEKGLTRSVLILADARTKMQFEIIGKKTGVYEWERYIDAEFNPNWEQLGIDWIENGIDPDGQSIN